MNAVAHAFCPSSEHNAGQPSVPDRTPDLEFEPGSPRQGSGGPRVAYQNVAICLMGADFHIPISVYQEESASVLVTPLPDIYLPRFLLVLLR
jgi:hypothetical protein